MLLRSTGFSSLPNAKRVPNYPENFFSRFQFNETFVDMVIARLRSDDIYNQISLYPNSEHRSVALSNQAGILFICLYFSPKTLHNQLSQMREITDKFFYDNWIIPIYMGITINLIDAWDSFRCAKQAVNGIFENNSLKILCARHKEQLEKLIPQTEHLLQEGVLNEEYILKHITKIIYLIKNCNITLRWFLLHTNPVILEFSGCKRQKQISDQILAESNFKSSQLFELLLNTSQLELIVKEILKEIMSEKEKRWNDYRTEASSRLIELSELFSGKQKILSKIEENIGLRNWFEVVSKEITHVSIENQNMSGRIIIESIQALEDVQKFHNLHSNMQVKQHIYETKNYLNQLVQLINLKEDVLIDIQLISDLSYAWCIIDKAYTYIMQESIKKSPNIVIKLRATFLKLATALEIPLLRINQAKSEDLVSVSRYYSNDLANYLRKVVQVIPETMFGILAKIVELQTDVIKELPTRLDKDKLKDFAQLEDRFQVSKLTYSISVFTEGILMMKKTLIGVIELDPKQLLEDGIRKELVVNLSQALHNGLIFSPKTKSVDLECKLEALTKVIDGYMRSFEYIQDYLNIKGLKILQEELLRIINYNVEKECNIFLRNKIQDWQSSFQSSTIPIPNHPTPLGDISNNFIGRLARELILHTHPNQSIYLDLRGIWYDRKTQNEILDAKIFTKIREAITPSGLVGLDKVFALMFTCDLEQNIEKINKNVTSDQMWLDLLNNLTRELENKMYIENPHKFYITYTTRWIKVWPKILDWIINIGHMQILRRHIAFELNTSCRLSAKNLESVITNFNRALMLEIRENSENFNKYKPIVMELNPYLLLTGLYEPLEQVFVITKNSHFVSLLLFLFTISHIHKFKYFKTIDCLVAKNSKDHLDCNPLVFGLLTVLKQFNPNVMELYLDYMCQYINSFVDYNLRMKQEINSDTQMVIHFMEIFIKLANMSRQKLLERIPEVVLNYYETMGTN
ncbi:WASH complex subunit homolog 5 isoform X2 [Condylostylus longicornis]|nr:WASH complex subunit homolog 5 isoform X2 [Condylostylus longicornis]